MESWLAEFITGMEVGRKQVYMDMEVFPILHSANHSPDYLTLGEAMEGRFVQVTEVTQGGAVPELKVTNTGDKPVLLLDGEELAGAKQNRILNTTMLIRKHSDTVIPVSCVEQGRWSYKSEHFESSVAMAPPRLRSGKNRSVSRSLEDRQMFASDQGEVWDEVSKMASLAKVSSATGAMHDVFSARTADLDAYLRAFHPIVGQKGLLVLISGKAAGLDYVSLESAYARLHPKLIRSYAMQAILEAQIPPSPSPEEAAKVFLAESIQAEQKRYKSIGHGWDFRFQGKTVVGSALVSRRTVIHMALFRSEGLETTSYMSDFQRRRGYRIL